MKKMKKNINQTVSTDRVGELVFPPKHGSFKPCLSLLQIDLAAFKTTFCKEIYLSAKLIGHEIYFQFNA